MGFYEDKVFPLLNDLTHLATKKPKRKVLEDATGTVLEIGFGTGKSLSLYPPSVKKVIGLEPAESMRSHGAAFVQNFNKAHEVEIEVIRDSAEKISIESASIDCVVSFLVLCTVPDQKAALSEIKRVLKPSGKLLFIEHVQSEKPFNRKMQNRLNPMWNKIGCGCNLNRDTIEAMEDAGLEVGELYKIGGESPFNLAAPIFAGQATPRLMG